jgi:sugar transferase (PEP-CTERM/EpsH1 system associated)
LGEEAVVVRILYLSHRFPFPPTFGSKVRAFHTIRHLSRSHDVTVFAPVRSDEEAEEAKGIAPHCGDFRVFPVRASLQAAKLALSTFSTVTASEAFFHSATMRRAARRLLASGQFDFVFVHCSSVGRVVADVTELPKLIDFCDVDSRKWAEYADFKPWPLSLGYLWEAKRLEAAERRLVRAFDLTTVATPGELDALLEIRAEPHKVDWFANGVDVDFFKPSEEPYDADLITFVGRMDYFPNEQAMSDFCRVIWPRLRAARPAVRLQIVGASPSAAVRRLESLPGVSVTGAVDDVRPYVRRSALTIAPLKIARGTQNKILESMAMGVPVVASSVAARGVDAVTGEHLLAAGTDADFYDAIVQILDDARLRHRLSLAARERVLSRHTWARSMQRVDALIERCVASHATASLAAQRL